MRVRIVAAVAYALLLAGLAYGERADTEYGMVGEPWDSILAVALVVAAVPVGFAIGRRWGVLPALVPVVASLVLWAIPGYEGPYNDLNTPAFNALGAVLLALLIGALLLIGIWLRRRWDGRQDRRAGSELLLQLHL